RARVSANPPAARRGERHGRARRAQAACGPARAGNRADANSRPSAFGVFASRQPPQPGRDAGAVRRWRPDPRPLVPSAGRAGCGPRPRRAARALAQDVLRAVALPHRFAQVGARSGPYPGTRARDGDAESARSDLERGADDGRAGAARDEHGGGVGGDAAAGAGGGAEVPDRGGHNPERGWQQPGRDSPARLRERARAPTRRASAARTDRAIAGERGDRRAAAVPGARRLHPDQSAVRLSAALPSARRPPAAARDRARRGGILCDAAAVAGGILTMPTAAPLVALTVFALGLTTAAALYFALIATRRAGPARLRAPGEAGLEAVPSRLARPPLRLGGISGKFLAWWVDWLESGERTRRMVRKAQSHLILAGFDRVEQVAIYLGARLLTPIASVIVGILFGVAYPEWRGVAI